MKGNKKDRTATIATNRFGMGARPGEINDSKSTPRAWLINSLAPIARPKGAPKAIEMIRLWALHKQQKDIRKKNLESSIKETANSMMKISPDSEISSKGVLSKNSGIAVKNAIESEASINWRLLEFFSNHFSVSAQNTGMHFLAPTLEWDAIAPHLSSSFSDMLEAVISHPAMLYYLNNEKSIGPNSKHQQKRKKLGLNENLAREIFELHTLGINGGYSQEDIIELSKGLTGWSMARHSKESEYQSNKAFMYRSQNHEPGSRVILNKKYPEHIKTNKQGRMILKDLANHPSTALHICTKLARHFVDDEPNTILIQKMSKTWIKTRGDLKAVMTTLIKSNYAWQPKAKKYKSPRDFLISTYRALNIKVPNEKKLTNSLKLLGQVPYSAGSPAGFGDVQATWDSSDALLNRIEWSDHLSKQLKKTNSSLIIRNTLATGISAHTLNIVNQAESQQQAVSLLLMSPEFLYR